MSTHRRARLLLYDYVRGGLDHGETQAVERHLAECPDCAREAESYRELLKSIPGPSRKPSDALPGSYWTGFANDVMRKIEAPSARRPGLVGRLLGGADPAPAGIGGMGGIGWISRLGSRAGRITAGVAAAAAVVAILWFSLPGGADRPDAPEADGRRTGADGTATTAFTGEAADSLEQFDSRLSDYFRKSKTLLVGVSNIAPATGEAFDLGAERRVSRLLLREARYLRSGPVDARSSRLIDDLDRILIGLANGEESASAPDIRMIRGGIESNNLLFKLRMQETRNQRLPVRQASYHK